MEDWKKEKLVRDIEIINISIENKEDEIKKSNHSLYKSDLKEAIIRDKEKLKILRGY